MDARKAGFHPLLHLGRTGRIRRLHPSGCYEHLLHPWLFLQLGDLHVDRHVDHHGCLDTHHIVHDGRSTGETLLQLLHETSRRHMEGRKASQSGRQFETR